MSALHASGGRTLPRSRSLGDTSQSYALQLVSWLKCSMTGAAGCQQPTLTVENAVTWAGDGSVRCAVHAAEVFPDQQALQPCPASQGLRTS